MHRLKITVERVGGYCKQPMLVGDHFLVEGDRIRIPEGKFICLWALQAMMPILPLLQRTDPRRGEWTGLAAQTFTCPDPKGRVHFRIERLEER